MKIQGLLKNTQFKLSIIVFSLITALFLINNLFILGGEGFFKTSNTLISPLAAIASSVLFARATVLQKDPVSRKLWAGMALGFGLWGLADAIWAVYALVLKIDLSFPSIADLFWAAAYIPLYYVLITRLRTLKIAPTKRQRRTVLFFSLFWLIPTAAFITLPMLIDYGQQPSLEGTFNLVYPLADLGLVIMTSYILVLLQEGRFAIAWRLIFTSIFILTFSDLVYSYAVGQGLYYPEGHVNFMTILADTTYSIAYLTTALGIHIYSLIQKNKESYVLSIETAPLATCHALVGTNKDNLVITMSDNFPALVKAKGEIQFYKMPLEKLLGVSSEEARALVDQTAARGATLNQPFCLNTTDREKREVWVTALAIFNPDHTCTGLNLALSADIDVPEEMRWPKNPELRGMLNYLLSLAGSRPIDENHSIRAYFNETMRLLSSMLYQFGGTPFINALFAELERTIQKQNLQLKISGQVIYIPAEYDGVTLAQALLPLLCTARAFACDLIGDQIIDNEMRDLEQQFKEPMLKDLDKYRMREFHLSAV